jgi:hypothetical protein
MGAEVKMEVGEDATDAADATAFRRAAASTRSKRKLYIFALTEYEFKHNLGNLIDSISFFN